MRYYLLLDTNNVISEIIPDYVEIFPNVPASQRYSANLLSSCVVRKDEQAMSGIHLGMVYDVNTDTFSEPTPEPASGPTEEYTVTESEANEAYRAGVNSVD